MYSTILGWELPQVEGPKGVEYQLSSICPASEKVSNSSSSLQSYRRLTIHVHSKLRSTRPKKVEWFEKPQNCTRRSSSLTLIVNLYIK